MATIFNYIYNYFYTDYESTLKYQKTLVNKEILLNNIILKSFKKITPEEHNFIMNIKKYNPKYNPKNKIGITNIIDGYL